MDRLLRKMHKAAQLRRQRESEAAKEERRQEVRRAHAIGRDEGRREGAALHIPISEDYVKRCMSIAADDFARLAQKKITAAEPGLFDITQAVAERVWSAMQFRMPRGPSGLIEAVMGDLPEYRISIHLPPMQFHNVFGREQVILSRVGPGDPTATVKKEWNPTMNRYELTYPT